MSSELAPMLLTDLLHAAGLPLPEGVPNEPVGAIRYDSRRVTKGDLFVAVRGTATDGHLHVEAAARAGAILAVVERPVIGLLNILVPSTRTALADVAAARSGFPARALQVTGITGTDGKTTSVYLLDHLLAGLGRTTGLLSTVAFKVGDSWEDNLARQSTLEAPEVQTALARMAAAGVEDAVVEATSHGLALHRVRRCAFDAALITNVTSEHLEFHGTREEYIAAKGLLLAALRDRDGKSGRPVAAINLDDAGSASLIPHSPVPVITFGLSPKAHVRAVNVRSDASGSTFILEADGVGFPAHTSLPGLFNVSNCLGVLALLYARGFPLDQALAQLETFTGVPGRMRRVDEGQPFLVVVDYAHTAASLEKVLRTLRPLVKGKLIVVFGSAGDRDREKRPVMGALAARLADFSILTDEDPRMERSEDILREIALGATQSGGREGTDFERIADRTSAVFRAIDLAGAGDVVLLAGKGHERSMLRGGESFPWDEEGVARQALRKNGFGR